MKQEESKLVMGPYNTNIKCCNTMHGKIKKICKNHFHGLGANQNNVLKKKNI